MDILVDVRKLLNKTKMMLSEKTEEDPTNNFGFVVEGIFLVIVALLGVLGNLLCIIAFSVKRNKNTFHHLMLGKIKYNIRNIARSRVYIHYHHQDWM